MKNEQNIFKLHAPYQPTGDQPQAIAELVKGFKEGNQFQTLLGVIKTSEYKGDEKKLFSRILPYY